MYFSIYTVRKKQDLDQKSLGILFTIFSLHPADVFAHLEP